MKIRLYLDEDAMDGDLVKALRMRGANVQTALEAGLIKRPDDEQLAYAARHERSLYSFNVADFMALHKAYMAEGKHHAGIILAQQQRYNIGDRCVGCSISSARSLPRICVITSSF